MAPTVTWLVVWLAVDVNRGKPATGTPLVNATVEVGAMVTVMVIEPVVTGMVVGAPLRMMSNANCSDAVRSVDKKEIVVVADVVVVLVN